ncbi:ubiquitin elongating factor core-domain-containing protein [Endogone sp. FLAS-F59071]|nr:ubiquitin elongating factor core-domain-containing protein [Endogone sp. FLAS-F59071]|eukprot:RUS16655.1 ubiquitin elongating factor core-domain-containing protein [Endogone sp. FLAS-F59071]
MRGTVRTIQVFICIRNSSLTSICDLSLSILNSIVRASPAGKDGVLSYLSSVVRKNDKRAQMQVDRNSVATDGFMGNLAASLLNFCEPFMDANFSKVCFARIDKIDPDYLRTPQSRVDVSKDTKINATQEESDALQFHHRVLLPHSRLLALRPNSCVRKLQRIFTVI